MPSISFNAPAQEPQATSEYLERLQEAQAELVALGFNSRSCVFLAANDSKKVLAGRLARGESTLPQIVEVYGQFAAIRLAEHTHRIATEEEKARFFNEQRLREEKYAEATALLPENKNATALVAALSRANQNQTPAAEPAARTVKPRAGEKE